MSNLSLKHIPNLLRRYRKERGLTQNEVAKLLGMKNKTRVSEWENGNGFPNLINAVRLSIIYRVMIDAIFIDLLYILREEIHQRESEIIEPEDGSANPTTKKKK